MNTQQTPDVLFNAYLNAKTDAQKKKALKEIEKVGGEQAIAMVKMLETMNLKGAK